MQKYGKIILAAVVIVGAVVGITGIPEAPETEKTRPLLANEDEVNEEPDETVDKGKQKSVIRCMKWLRGNENGQLLTT